MAGSSGHGERQRPHACLERPRRHLEPHRCAGDVARLDRQRRLDGGGVEVGGDFGPYFQSERTARHQEAVARGLAEGWLYRCFAVAETVEAQREEARAAKRNWRFDPASRALSAAEAEAQKSRAERELADAQERNDELRRRCEQEEQARVSLASQLASVEAAVVPHEHGKHVRDREVNIVETAWIEVTGVVWREVMRETVTSANYVSQ